MASRGASSQPPAAAPTRRAIIADHLVEANLRGHDSHGVGLIPNYLQHLARRHVFGQPQGPGRQRERLVDRL